MSSPKSIRLSPMLDSTIAANGGGRGLSHRLSQMADRYSEILRRAGSHELTDAEMNAVRDAMNGQWSEPATTIRGAPWIAIEDSLPDGLADKWQIDGPALVEKLRRLSYPQEVALIEEIERWWSERANAPAT